MLKVKDMFNSNLPGATRLKIWEKTYIGIGMAVSGGKKKTAARFLGITEKTLHAKLLKYPDIEKNYPKKPDHLRVNRMINEIQSEIVAHQAALMKKIADAKIKEVRKKPWFKAEKKEEQERIEYRIKRLYR